MADVKITAEPRTEFGKGAARRTRRAGRVPAVLYGHGTDPVHLSFDTVEFAAVMRENGRNAVLTVTGVGSQQLALTKSVVRDPIKGFIEHVDLVVVRRGEKVQVDVRVVTLGEAASGTLVFQNEDTLTIEADALNIPEEISVVIDGAEIGTQFLAGDIRLPDGAELVSDPELLVVNVTEAPTEEALEEEIDTEGAGVEEDAPESEDGEGSERGEGSEGGAPEDPEAAAEGETPGKED
ncbi:50S ribosomal protein L25/general stress protein Ctc [Actinomycetospora sp. TBRC 11914]|uniref:50S ribosomal protein L25/general stress protein Ctc n=1 Tax=Actinomycetospora sp. TBRC 11914 TaxID=2729387 RepID=UPI00145DB4E0|nr:50S ribosomal protein L25/general stress protein Ctc [Actinomycetospora sp. TBRC 11914]NMO92563.1 50S ribosomal protein L25/general stress protein Ctc [Actinomycetospora sp. TBRC 11914]